MNIINLRKNLRRTSMTRRETDRRNVPYAFGSPQWLENIKNNYLAWPKSNRRSAERRNNERRALDRREQQQLAERGRLKQAYSRIFMSPEEKKLIEDVYFNKVD
jgi:hypothetical protein